MTVADNLRALVSELRPLIDERLDIDERISEIRGPASDKGLDFSQAKSLVVALARDSRDGGDRVAKLTAKADNASWYADMLKSPTMAETSNNSPQSPADKSSPPHSVASPSPRSQSDGAAVLNSSAPPSDTAATAPAKEAMGHQSPGSDKAPNQRPNRQGKTAPPSASVVDAIGIGTGVDPGELLDPIKLITESLSPGDDGDVRGSPFDRNRVEA